MLKFYIIVRASLTPLRFHFSSCFQWEHRLAHSLLVLFLHLLREPQEISDTAFLQAEWPSRHPTNTMVLIEKKAQIPIQKKITHWPNFFFNHNRTPEKWDAATFMADETCYNSTRLTPVDTIVLSWGTIATYGTNMFCIGHQCILASSWLCTITSQCCWRRHWWRETWQRWWGRHWTQSQPRWAVVQWRSRWLQQTMHSEWMFKYTTF